MSLSTRLALAGATALAISVSASAGFTTVHAPSAPGEIGHAAILSGVYGGTFSASGVDFSNGSITATRVHDFNGFSGHSQPLNLLGTNMGTANDQIWVDGIAHLQAVARYAGYNQSFGYYQGSDDPSTGFTSGTLLTLSTNPFLGDGPTAGPINIQGEWRWGRTGTTTNSSLNTDNADNRDHMVTYRITGSGLASLGYSADAVVWMLFWDDQPYDSSDRDFNDLAVEIVAVAMAIPIPAPIALAGLGLIGVVVSRRRLAAAVSR
jgi:hypothetical protein